MIQCHSCLSEVKHPAFERSLSSDLASAFEGRRSSGLASAFNSTLENRNGLFFLQAEITALPKRTKLQIHNTEQEQIGMIAPTTTLTPQRPADTG